MNVVRTVLIMVACIVLLSGRMSSAAEPMTTFDTPEQEALYYSLLPEYRCLKCQNQNLADSHASLADDLRREIRQQILDGKTREDIDQYLVARYGEFVFYRPRFSSKTVLLWVGPFALLLLCLASVFIMIRRRRARSREQRVADVASSPQGAEELAARLEEARRLLRD